MFGIYAQKDLPLRRAFKADVNEPPVERPSVQPLLIGGSCSSYLFAYCLFLGALGVCVSVCGYVCGCVFERLCVYV